jgi:hypothetical protein
MQHSRSGPIWAARIVRNHRNPKVQWRAACSEINTQGSAKTEEQFTKETCVGAAARGTYEVKTPLVEELEAQMLKSVGMNECWK